MDSYSQRAMTGAALAPLNNRQKARICMLARRAFDRQSQAGALGDAAEPEVWRKEQQRHTCGQSSLTACTNKDYLALKARFQDLAGEHVAAFRNHLRAEN